MGNEKITANMSVLNMVTIMSEGVPEAINVVMTMINNPDLSPFLLLCDSLGIRGSRLDSFYNNCCGRNNEKFKRTLTMLKRNVFTPEEVEQCLNLPYGIPFIDDTITVDGIPPYGQAFDISHPKWKEFCQKNRAIFLEKLNKYMSVSTHKM